VGGTYSYNSALKMNELDALLKAQYQLKDYVTPNEETERK